MGRKGRAFSIVMPDWSLDSFVITPKRHLKPLDAFADNLQFSIFNLQFSIPFTLYPPNALQIIGAH